jgi:hypothetical protein
MTRKKQVQTFMRDVQLEKLSLSSALKDACFVGACEAREQAIKIIRAADSIPLESRFKLIDSICEVPTLELLGWKKREKKRS